jgi:hypothetical protein
MSNEPGSGRRPALSELIAKWRGESERFKTASRQRNHAGDQVMDAYYDGKHMALENCIADALPASSEGAHGWQAIAPALKQIGISGNHLASSLLNAGVAIPSCRDWTYDAVLDRYSQPYADMWVAWKAIMDARDAYESTSSALAASSPGRWEPIETAPKDESIVVWVPYPNGSRPGHWHPARWNDDCHAKRPQPRWKIDSVWGERWGRTHQPSHWMPLPASPREP